MGSEMCIRDSFSGNSVEESLRNLTNVPAPSVIGINPTIPKSIDSLISKLMAKKAEDRIPTALVLLHKIDDIEKELRDDASAQTSHGKLSSKNTIIQSGDSSESASSNALQAESYPQTVGFVHGPTSASTDDLELSNNDEVQPVNTEDFFNQVTESLRRQHSEKVPEVESGRTGLLPLVLALVGVITLGIYGWVRVSTPPTAEQLFAQIELNNDAPDKVVEEIGLFLKNYPDDPRVSNLVELQGIGVAIKDYQSLKNTLTVRARSPSGLSDVEKTFLDLTSLAKKDARLAGEKMTAFVLVNEAVVLDEQDLKCVNAARGYSLKLNHELRTKAQTRLGNIHNAFFKASQMEDPKQALKMCQSLLELYSDSDFSALRSPEQGTKALRLVRARVAELENQIRMEALEAQKKAQVPKETTAENSKDLDEEESETETPINEDSIEEDQP